VQEKSFTEVIASFPFQLVFGSDIIENIALIENLNPIQKPKLDSINNFNEKMNMFMNCSP
jgi:hypothetical protein